MNPFNSQLALPNRHVTNHIFRDKVFSAKVTGRFLFVEAEAVDGLAASTSMRQGMVLGLAICYGVRYDIQLVSCLVFSTSKGKA